MSLYRNLIFTFSIRHTNGAKIRLAKVEQIDIGKTHQILVQLKEGLTNTEIQQMQRSTAVQKEIKFYTGVLNENGTSEG